MALNSRIPDALMDIFKRAYEADPSATEGNLIYLRLHGAHTFHGSLSINFSEVLLELQSTVRPTPLLTSPKAAPTLRAKPKKASKKKKKKAVKRRV
jgi:hypothetical protein